MFQLMIRKMWNKKWMVTCLLIGNILLIAVASGTPMYTDAVINRVLTKTLTKYMEETNTYPFLIQTKKLVGSVNDAKRVSQSVLSIEEKFLQIEERFHIPLRARNFNKYISCYNSSSVSPRSDDVRRKEVHLGSFSDFPSHSKILAGRIYSNTLEDGAIEVVVSRRTLREEGWILGEEIFLHDLKDKKGDSIVIRITGVFERNAQEDVYWTEDPNDYSKRYVMDEGLFHDLFVDYEKPEYGVNSQWSVMPDYTKIKSEEVGTLITKGKELKAELELLSESSQEIPFIQILENYVVQVNKLNTTLYLLQIPVFVLLAIYIIMVSKQIMEIEKNEIAILKSRGADNGQIMRIYIYQSLSIAVISMILGVGLGFAFCKAMGSTNSFLVFVGRTALETKLNGQAIWFAFFGMLFSLSVILLEALKGTKGSIVAQKRSRGRKSDAPLWKKIYLDVLMFGVSFYGLYNYYNNKEHLVQKVLTGASMDPVLFISSILFIIGSTLIALRLFPFLIRLNFRMVKKRCSAPVYTTYKQILKIEQGESFIFLFLVLTISIGIYNGNVARTINSNEINRIQYLTGADVVIQEKWDKISTFVNTGGEGTMSGTYAVKEIEEDITDYEQMEGIQSITKVFVDNKIRVPSNELNQVTLMGIHTKEFGETVEFQDELLETHWYHYLNAMSEKQEGILVSQNFASEFGYQVGDIISYTHEAYGTIDGVICGFVSYWPSYRPVERRFDNGTMAEAPNYLIISHLSFVQSLWGVQPYQLWMGVDGSTSFLYDYAKEQNKTYTIFHDLQASLIEKNQDPIFQGTNGILTLGFLIVLILCAIGFLIYWITSIRGRALYFGVCAAMGMSVKDIYKMLLLEQFYMSGLPVAFGFLTGYLTSKLYIPFIQLSYSGADQVIPLIVTGEVRDVIRVLVLVTAMIGAGIFILGGLISKLKITQTLKLGED